MMNSISCMLLSDLLTIGYTVNKGVESFICLGLYLRSRLWTSSQASWRLSSVYMRNRMRRPHAKLLVSCFNKLGFDFPLKPWKYTRTCTQSYNHIFYVSSITHYVSKVLIKVSISYINNICHQHENKATTFSQGLVPPPAFHSMVLCSLLELKALAKWCDSRRQSSSLKSCSEVR